MAERVGFEPTAHCCVTGFQDQLLKPLGHLSSYDPETNDIILDRTGIVNPFLLNFWQNSKRAQLAWLRTFVYRPNSSSIRIISVSMDIIGPHRVTSPRQIRPGDLQS